MKTDDLINALVADTRSGAPPYSRTVALALAAGALGALAAFATWIGPRADFPQALGTVRFVLKFVIIGAVAVPAIAVVFRMGRPGAAPGLWRWALAVGPVLLVAAVAGELFAVPADAWGARQVGVNARHCLTIIPLLAVLPLAALLAALRNGAPTRPGLAGAAAGLAAACVSAAFYAANCIDDSPLFVATWYPIAFAVVMAAGSLLGRRMLRW